MSRQFLTPVVLPADPTAAMEAATKQYVDGLTAGVNEVFIGPSDPGAAYELWVDEDATSVAAGVGVPGGGTAGQVFTKKSSADNDVEWTTAPWYTAWGKVAYAEKTADQLGITAVADVTGLSVTWIAVAGRLYRTSCQVSQYVSLVDTIPGINITDAAGTGKQNIYDSHDRVTSSHIIGGAVIESGLSGSITRKVRARRALGTGTVNIEAALTYPAFILVEDIGPA